jgi:DNA modification methylase
VTGAAIVRADAVRIPLRDATVDLIITSPPYFSLRSYRDGDEHYDGQIGSEPTPTAFLCALWAVMDECWRVLAPGGSAWVNLGDKYAGSGGHNNAGISASSTLQGNGHVGGVSRTGEPQKIKRTERATRRNAPDRYTQAADVRTKSLMGLPWRFVLGLIDPMHYRSDHYDGETRQWLLRAEVIWSKPNGLPESVRDRVRRSHEQWFHLTKEPRYFAGVDEVREVSHPANVAHAARYSGRYGRINDANTSGHGHKSGSVGANPLGKLPGSVWSIPSQPLKVPPELGVDHFAAFPAEWPRRIIAGWSPVGICTACGEGRRAVVAKRFVQHWRQTATATGRFEAVEGQGVAAHYGDRHIGGHDEATITGYACACPDTSAPTRPAVVLDPFGGTGTVAMMARAMGRYGVSIDLSADYNRLARWRIFESGHGERALAKAEAKRMPAPKKRKRRVQAITKTVDEPAGQLQLSLSDPTALTREINSKPLHDDQEGAAR